MKKNLTLFLFTLSLTSLAQEPSRVVDNKIHKFVMQFSASDSAQQMSIITQLGNVREAWPNAKIEVVCHSGGLDLLLTAKSKVANQVNGLSAQGVIFSACNNTMRRRNVKKEDLLSSALVVPSAFVELVLKQEEGWAYIKGGH